VFEAQLTRRFSHSSANAAFNEAYSPGNGVYLTSKIIAASVGYSYVGLKRATMSVSAGYSRMSSLGQALGVYSGFAGGMGATYRVTGYIHTELRYDYRHYTTGGVGYSQNDNRVSLGLAFSPGARPLAIW
jgi:hypothetical protein